MDTADMYHVLVPLQPKVLSSQKMARDDDASEQDGLSDSSAAAAFPQHPQHKGKDRVKCEGSFGYRFQCCYTSILWL